MIDSAIKKIVSYGVETGLLPKEEKIYAVNLILDCLKKDTYSDDGKTYSNVNLEETLEEILDYAAEQGIIEDSQVYRDLFDTRIMNCITPRPVTVIDRFNELFAKSPKEATDYFYKFSQDSDYIRRYRICKDIRWKVPTEYGDIDITINLSKPEKDPRAIAAAKLAKQDKYPKCQLCMENVGYAGRVDHPARETHRVIPLVINGSEWGFQYSPYSYYNEHCIVFNGRHVPMKIDRETFVKLFDFVRMFPHYMLGSNADLPIVGGSILSHDHFQGGNYEFAMAKAPVERSFAVKGYEDVECGILKWPMSVIRLRCTDTEPVIELADHILKAWRSYSDEKAFVLAETNGEPHNTITPIARFKDGRYELDLVLRNNITTEEYPLGVYHPHQELHHIKKENIGLIEVMGLAVLPARLKDEMEILKDCLINGKDIRADERISKHADWVEAFMSSYGSITADNAEGILRNEIGKVFLKVLEHAGVFKRNPDGQKAFDRFVGTL
ncbi:MAG: UDP-glucose--hexose-1-phosphate uridylyltransferase [Butyrivibrio sp.]